MILSILKLPLRVVRRIARTVRGGDPAPQPAPAPRPRPVEPPAWMQEEQDEGHSHDHGHDHGHSHDHAPEPAPAAGGVDVFPEDTPNPNAYKFTVSVRVTDKAFSASTPEEATTDLARALIAIDGVASIFGVNDFVTVTKDGGAAWSAVIPAVTAALKANIKA
jgi:hypothetical protein